MKSEPVHRATPQPDPKNLPSRKPASLHFWNLLARLQQWRDRTRPYKRSIDSPKLPADVRLHDVSFHSEALGGVTTYRVIQPGHIKFGTRLPAVYLLHAAGDDHLGWSNDSDVARFAALGFILVMPNGGFSHFANVARGPQENYADFITHDLRLDVESRFAASTERNGRALVGVSMGGFGAMHLALRNPHLYAFAAGISSALNVVDFPLSPRNFLTWLMLHRVFGSESGSHRRETNPFRLASSLTAESAPYIYLTCSRHDHLITANRRFVDALIDLNLPHTFHVTDGDHDWQEWNAELPALFRSLSEHVRAQARQ